MAEFPFTIDAFSATTNNSSGGFQSLDSLNTQTQNQIDGLKNQLSKLKALNLPTLSDVQNSLASEQDTLTQLGGRLLTDPVGSLRDAASGAMNALPGGSAVTSAVKVGSWFANITLTQVIAIVLGLIAIIFGLAGLGLKQANTVIEHIQNHAGNLLPEEV